MIALCVALYMLAGAMTGLALVALDDAAYSVESPRLSVWCVAALAVVWPVSALAFVAVGIELLATEVLPPVIRALRQRYGR